MTYEPQYWDIAEDGAQLFGDFNEKLKQLVDENVRSALCEYFKGIHAWFRVREDGTPVLEIWADEAYDDEMVKTFPLHEMTSGIEGDMDGAEASEKIASVLEGLAAYARESAAKWRAQGGE